MFIPRYWKRVEKEIVIEKVHSDHVSLAGENVPLKLNAWGYSDDSEAQALERANERIFEIAKTLASSFNENEYYPLRILHEDIIKRIGREDTALVTRNRYGSTVLNSSSMMFIDIDVHTDDLQPAGFFARLFGKTKKIEDFNVKETERRFNAALEKVDEYVSKDRECGFLVYRTFAGLRLIATHKIFDPSSEASQKIFDALGTDPLYQKLCKAQNSFRARVSPKYWRMKKEFVEKLRLAPRLKYRITKEMIPTWSENDAERLEEYDTWVKNYEQMHEAHATCKFLKQIGNREVVDDFMPLIKYHDRATQANRDLPLA